LDLVGSSINQKFRNLRRPFGDKFSAGSCASFYVETINETPYQDNLEMIFDLIAPMDHTKYGDYDATGLALTGAYSNTFGTQDLPIVLDDTRRQWRLNICPDGDDRDFISRGQRFAGKCSDHSKTLGPGEAPMAGRPLSEECTGLWDADGDASTADIARIWIPPLMDEREVPQQHSGYLYCNVGVRFASKCEDAYGLWGAAVKGYVWDNETMGSNLCSDYNPLTKKFPSSPSCWTKAIPEILDGSQDMESGIMFAYESVLKRDVLIPCLSFHPTEDLCKLNPCAGGTGY